MGAAAGLKILADARSEPAPKDADAALRMGFHSHTELDRLAKIIDDPDGASEVSSSDLDLIKEVVRREGDAKWFAVAAIGNLSSPKLQGEFLTEMRTLLAERPVNGLATRVLHRWMRNGGQRHVAALAKDANGAVSSVASQVIEDEKRLGGPRS